jgi:hypothetical protein
MSEFRGQKRGWIGEAIYFEKPAAETSYVEQFRFS